jgi:16S rRNA U1498 N3-methylase RsmE
MTAAVFVVEESRLAGLAPGDRVVVDGPEGRHGSAVRRLQVGEQVDVVDGAGLRARGTVAAVPAGDRFDVAVAELVAEPVLQPRITVAMALLKGERMERAVAMLTELGVDEIIPWAAARSIAQWRPDRAAKAHARLVGTVQAAGKQSRRARFPQLAPLADAERVADRIGRADSGLCCTRRQPTRWRARNCPTAARSLPSSARRAASHRRSCSGIGRQERRQLPSAPPCYGRKRLPRPVARWSWPAAAAGVVSRRSPEPPHSRSTRPPPQYRRPSVP